MQEEIKGSVHIMENLLMILITELEEINMTIILKEEKTMGNQDQCIKEDLLKDGDTEAIQSQNQDLPLGKGSTSTGERI